MSDIETICKANHDRAKAQEAEEKRKEAREEAECRRLTRFVARLSHWAAGATTVLVVVAASNGVGRAAIGLCFATALLLTCGWILEG